MKNIRILIHQLKRRANKVTNKKFNQEKENLDFFNIYEDESEMETIEINNLLQKSFLNFILQIMSNFVVILNNKNEENAIDSEDIQIQKSNRESIVQNKSSIEYEGDFVNNEESQKELAISASKIFREKFKKTSKYNSFIVKFCKNNEINDLYRIPFYSLMNLCDILMLIFLR